MTIREMIDYIQAEVNSRRFWNDERIISIINLLQQKLSVELKLSVRDFYKFSSTLEQRYLLPSNLLSIESLWYDNAGMQRNIRIVAKPSDVYGLNTDPDTDKSDNPYKAFMWTASGRNELWMFPMFDTAGIDIWMWFYGLPSNISTDNDVSSLPIETHVYIVEAVKNRITQVDEQITKAEELALWRNIVNECKQIDTVKNIIQRGSQLTPQSVGEAYDDFGLVDGSQRGILWNQ
jgi:hypothetical protein